jgi:membrane fusion protein
MSHRLLTLVVVALAVIAIFALVFGHYTRRVHVTGSLVPAAGMVSMQAGASGVVHGARALEGKHVRKGDVVFSIDSEHVNQSLGDVAEATLHQLQDDNRRIELDLANTQRAQTLSERDLRLQQAALKSRIASLDGELTAARQQVATLNALLTRIAPLERKGYASTLDIQQQKTQLFDAETQVRTVQIQSTEAAEQLAALGVQLQQLPISTAFKLSELRRQRSQNDQALTHLEGERSTALVAPCDGDIELVLVKDGQSVVAGSRVLSIAPSGSPLRADLLLPSDAIGFVHTNASVALHYQPFPFEKFGTQAGVVLSVGGSALSPNEVDTLLGRQLTDQALFQVIASIPSQTILAYGKPVALKPGMAVDADILLDRRSLLEWLFEPVLRVARQTSSSSQTR